MSRAAVAALLLAVVTGTASLGSTEVIAEMTPDRIREAIEVGTKAKEAPIYRIRKRGMMGSAFKPVLGAFSTPFSRVADAAYQSKRDYKPFTEQNVTPEMIAPELHVYGLAHAEGAKVSSVRTVVITPKNNSSPASAIRPTSEKDLPVEFRNALGMKADGRGVLAVFPIATGTMQPMRPSWRAFVREEWDDLGAKLWLTFWTLVLLVPPATALSVMGFPDWFVGTLFVIGFVCLFAVWAAFRAYALFWPFEIPGWERFKRSIRAPRSKGLAPKAEVVEASPELQHAVLSKWAEIAEQKYGKPGQLLGRSMRLLFNVETQPRSMPLPQPTARQTSGTAH